MTEKRKMRTMKTEDGREVEIPLMRSEERERIVDDGSTERRYERYKRAVIEIFSEASTSFEACTKARDLLDLMDIDISEEHFPKWAKRLLHDQPLRPPSI